MKLVLLSIFAGVAAAFAPSRQAVKSTVAVNAFEGELGDQAPLGFWDPLGLSDDGDDETFERRRYVELKHGRICMLAFLGEITTRAGVHLPGNIDYSGTSFDSIPNGYAAIAALPKAGVIQLLLLVGFLELFIMRDLGGGEFPGDFRNDSLDYGWDTFDAEEQESKRRIELANGRAAMMGVITLLVTDQLGIEMPLISGLPA